jgi:2-polyprenyl-6-methoxyphenol hydroxylase-like FAD-dependent oxidoreductase
MNIGLQPVGTLFAIEAALTQQPDRSNEENPADAPVPERHRLLQACGATKTVDVLLIGGGIMSASLGTYLTELEPGWKVDVYERMDQVAEESSNAWNNAGTGHSAFCELNYTSEGKDGSIDISKAVNVNEQFEVSKQFWAYQVEQGVLSNPPSFINNVPHMSFVWGEENIAFLHKRVAALQHSSLFRGMQISEDREQIRQWAPLVMEGRDPGQKVAATRMAIGTDVNFGEITRQLFASMTRNPNVQLHLSHEVRDIVRNEDGSWNVVVADLANGGAQTSVKAKFVFIGAGAVRSSCCRNPASRKPRLCRLPGGRPVPDDRQPGHGRPAPGQAVRQGVGRRATDVGAAPRHPDDRWQAGPAVRPVRDLLHQVPEARLAAGHVRLADQPQRQPHAACRYRQHRPEHLPDGPADAQLR